MRSLLLMRKTNAEGLWALVAFCVLSLFATACSGGGGGGAAAATGDASTAGAADSAATTSTAGASSTAGATTSNGASSDDSASQAQAVTGVYLAGTLDVKDAVPSLAYNRTVELRDNSDKVIVTATTDGKGRYKILANAAVKANPSGYKIFSLIEDDGHGKALAVSQPVVISAANYDPTQAIYDQGIAFFLEISAIRGQVAFLDENNAPVPGIDPTKTSAFLPGFSIFARTDNEGRFLLLYVPAGEYQLRVENGSLSNEQAVVVEKEKTLNLGLIKVSRDVAAPAEASIAIKDGLTITKETTVDLVLHATGATQMYITNTDSCLAGGKWVAYATSRASWALALNAVNRIYAQFKDAAGNISDCVSATILQDSIAPTPPVVSVSNAVGNSTAGVSGPVITTSVAHIVFAPQAGIVKMRVSISLTWPPGDWCRGDSAEFIAYSTTYDGTLQPGTNIVVTNFQDSAGNISDCTQTYVTYDTPRTLSNLTLPPAQNFTKTTVAGLAYPVIRDSRVSIEYDTTYLGINSGTDTISITYGTSCTNTTYTALPDAKLLDVPTGFRDSVVPLSIRVKDGYGVVSNCLTVPQAFYWHYTSPTCTVSPAATFYRNTLPPYSINLTCTDPLGLGLQINSANNCETTGTWSTFTNGALSWSPTIASNYDGGSYCHVVRDASGASAQAATSMTYDTEAPVAPTVLTQGEYTWFTDKTGSIYVSGGGDNYPGATAGYEIAIGSSVVTTNGTGDILDWTLIPYNSFPIIYPGDVSLALPAFASSMQEGQYYHVSARTVDEAGNRSPAITVETYSSGFTPTQGFRVGNSGVLDTTFDASGKLEFNAFGQIVSEAYNPSDRTLVACGNGYIDGSGNHGIEVWRLFGEPFMYESGFTYTHSASGATETCKKVIYGTDNKYYVMVNREDTTTQERSVQIHQLGYGSAEPTYASSGIFNFTFGHFGSAMVSESGTHKIAFTTRSSAGWILVKLKTDGTLDTDFNTTGKVTLVAGSTAALSDTDGALIYKNGFYYAATANQSGSTTIVKVSATTGALVSAFGTGGVKTIDKDAGIDDTVSAMNMDTDGKILITGGPGTMRINGTTGALDTTFNASGTVPGVATHTFSSKDYTVTDMALQGNDKAVLVGTSDSGTKMAVFRLTKTGVLDTTFANSSTPSGIYSESGAAPGASTFAFDAKLIVGGLDASGATVWRFK